VKATDAEKLQKNNKKLVEGLRGIDGGTEDSYLTTCDTSGDTGTGVLQKILS